MWTEILSEDVGVTHVNGSHVCFGIGDVAEDDVRDAKDCLERRQTRNHVAEQARELKYELEREIEWLEICEKYDIDISGYDNSRPNSMTVPYDIISQ